MAILQLQERGLLDVKDPIGKYFASAPADKRGITIWQLMKHRPPVVAVIDGLISALNSGDTASLRRFISAHFASGPDAPTAEQRMERIGGLHGELGNLRVTGMVANEDGTVEVTVQTEREGQAQLLMDIEKSKPYRIRRMGVQIGGD